MLKKQQKSTFNLNDFLKHAIFAALGWVMEMRFNSHLHILLSETSTMFLKLYLTGILNRIPKLFLSFFIWSQMGRFTEFQKIKHVVLKRPHSIQTAYFQVKVCGTEIGTGKPNGYFDCGVSLQ